MRDTLRILLAIVSLTCAATSWGAEVGRVILAAGDTVVVRGTAQPVRVVLGAAVQDTDVLRTGAASNLQVRFTDETIESLRENSEMRVDEYNFSGKQDGSESMGLRLLKGGLRVVTGLVGRSNEKNFAVRSTTATIGIRGTDFGTAVCQQDCRNADGSLARDGQYGRVHGQSHGTNQINVSNERDAKQFGINENFFVADAKSLVEPLLVPPDFIASRLESRKQGGTGAAGGTGQEQTATGGSSQDARGSNELPPPLQGLQYTEAENRTSTGGLAITGDANATPTIGAVFGLHGDVDGMSRGGFFTPPQLQTDPPGAASNLASSQKLIGFTLPASSATGGIATTGSAPSASVIDETTSNSLNAHWGRWLAGSITDNTGTTVIDNTNQFHYLYGPLTPYEVIASKTGSFTMTNIGGTTPTNEHGGTGTITALGVTVNFSARTVSLGNINMNFPANAQQWVFNPGGTAAIQPGNGGAFFSLTSTGSCIGAGCNPSPGTATLRSTGIFLGSRGDHLGINFQAVNAGASQATTSRIFSCASAGC
jgi:hypothetical protein